MGKVLLKIKEKSIKHVEKGNVLTSSNPVCAFTVEQDGVDIKLLLKGDQAKCVYNNFLKDGKTKNSIKLSDEYDVLKEVTVSFDAELKDYKYGQIIVQNPSFLSFKFKYDIV